ncbi:MAG TPA: hypothetical protein VL588_04780 [Bdellovibrionota bacterium]|jgi:hypothetical protein|nr:hypothetical protein [Bdellovibrionota bacterium]
MPVWLAIAALVISSNLTHVGEPSSRPPDPAEMAITRFWAGLASLQASLASQRIQSLRARIDAELDQLPGHGQLPIPKDTELRMQGSYGVLPEVYVDKGYGATFPHPMPVPVRISWFDAWTRARRLVRQISTLEGQVDRWSRLPVADKIKDGDRLEGIWLGLTSDLTELASTIRYLTAWWPRLVKSRGGANVSGLFALVRDPRLTGAERRELWERLRDVLRPHRVLTRSFLPETLKPGSSYVVPVATDIADRSFLAEVEGAVDMHWNHSPWAQAQRISFRIQWKQVPLDRPFKLGRRTIDEHVASFPKTAAAMTTGADSHFTRDNVLVLAPGHITARTLAHEFGHLLGFDDCYFRTLAAQGFRGAEILEWSNPVYPDDLMCDDGVGVARAEVW